MKTKLIICAWLCFVSLVIIAQNQDILSFTQDNYISFTYDNDFFNATDRYYTQGIRLELGHPIIKKSPISLLLFPFSNKSFQQYGIAVAQDCFTPPSIQRDTIQTGQRPFSGALYLSHLLTVTQTQKRQKIITQFDIGMIGPCAQCKEMQMGIHRLLDNITPKGWQFQLANDIILNYSLEFEKGFWLRKRLELLGFSNIRIGTLYNNITAGSLLRIGFFKPYFEHQEQVNKSKFHIHIFINGYLKLVGYDATLQGGLFNRNNIYTLSSEQINRIVASGAIGMILSYQNIDLEFTRVFLSPDYKNGLSHGWGHIQIKFGF